MVENSAVLDALLGAIAGACGEKLSELRPLVFFCLMPAQSEYWLGGGLYALSLHEPACMHQETGKVEYFGSYSDAVERWAVNRVRV